jgi:phosphomethylpyrimidine synthase
MGETAPRPMKNCVRKYAAEQGMAEEEALKAGMEQKAREFVKKGAEIYAKA